MPSDADLALIPGICGFKMTLTSIPQNSIIIVANSGLNLHQLGSHRAPLGNSERSPVIGQAKKQQNLS